MCLPYAFVLYVAPRLPCHHMFSHHRGPRSCVFVPHLCSMSGQSSPHHRGQSSPNRPRPLLALARFAPVLSHLSGTQPCPCPMAVTLGCRYHHTPSVLPLPHMDRWMHAYTTMDGWGTSARTLYGGTQAHCCGVAVRHWASDAALVGERWQIEESFFLLFIYVQHVLFSPSNIILRCVQSKSAVWSSNVVVWSNSGESRNARISKHCTCCNTLLQIKPRATAWGAHVWQGRRGQPNAGGGTRPGSYNNKALFRSKNFLDFDTVALSFLFDKYYPIMEQLGLKDSSRDLQINCATSYLFYIYLMFHACAAKFDVMGNLVKFWIFGCI